MAYHQHPPPVSKQFRRRKKAKGHDVPSCAGGACSIVCSQGRRGLLGAARASLSARCRAPVVQGGAEDLQRAGTSRLTQATTGPSPTDPSRRTVQQQESTSAQPPGQPRSQLGTTREVPPNPPILKGEVSNPCIGNLFEAFSFDRGFVLWHMALQFVKASSKAAASCTDLQSADFVGLRQSVDVCISRKLQLMIPCTNYHAPSSDGQAAPPEAFASPISIFNMPARADGFAMPYTTDRAQARRLRARTAERLRACGPPANPRSRCTHNACTSVLERSPATCACTSG